MDAETRWRRRLALIGPIAPAIGIALGVYAYVSSIWPYPYCFPTCALGQDTDWIYVVALFAGPILVVLGPAALFIRWRMPHVLDLPRGHRAASAILVAVIATMSAAVVGLILFILLAATTILASCSAHGC